VVLNQEQGELHHFTFGS